MAKKKLHWTQTPEGRKRVTRMLRKATKMKSRLAKNRKKTDRTIKELKEAEVNDPFTLKDPLDYDEQAKTASKSWTRPDGSTLTITSGFAPEVREQVAYLHGKCQQMIETFVVLTGTNLIDLTTGVATRLNASIGS